MDLSNIYDYLVPEDWNKAVQATVFGTTWQFGQFSQDSKSVKFWYMDLMNQDFFTETMFAKICSDTKQTWRLDRVYANGQTHGLSGDMHQDTKTNETGRWYTCLYYANPEWHETWGGYTIFRDPKSGGTLARYPTPNSMAFFDSTIWHAGLEPTRHCAELRVTIAFKLERQ